MKLKDMRRKQTKESLEKQIKKQIQDYFNKYNDLLGKRPRELCSESITSDWGYVELKRLAGSYHMISEILEMMAEDFKTLDEIKYKDNLAKLMEADLKYAYYDVLFKEERDV